MFNLGKINVQSLNKLATVLGKLELCEPKLIRLAKIQTANIISKACRDPDYKRPKPFPYEKKPLSLGFFSFDNSLARYDENTKLIIVDGNIGVGKSTVAKQLAEALDMRFFPEANVDALFTTHYGYDYRDLNTQLPREAQFVDLKKFYEDPKHPCVSIFQMHTYHMRFRQHIDVLNHILNTGQGAIMERSVFSDFVFPIAMQEEGYVTKDFLDYYFATRENSLKPLLPPHLVIYLDAPVETLLKNIKKRNIPFEVNSKVLNENYLTAIETAYKKEYLKEAKEEGEILVYDWTKPGDVDFMVDDIERIDFDSYIPEDSQCRQWRHKETEWDWKDYRNILTEKRDDLQYELLKITPFECPEMWISAHNYIKYLALRKMIPGEKFEVGFNAECGDKGLLFKRNANYYHEGYLRY